MTRQYIALIPAYNPTSILCDLVRNFCNAGFSIVVVNDGSKDDCSSIFEECFSRATVLHHPRNAGKGQALKTGLSYIYSNFAPDSVVVTVDANGQHAVEDALTICQLAAQHNRSLVLGRRSFDKDTPLRCRFRNKLTALMFYQSTGLRLQDPASGLRAIAHSLIPALLRVYGQRYDYEMNVLLHLTYEKMRILEYPVKTPYSEQYSIMHFKMVKEVFQNAQTVKAR